MNHTPLDPNSFDQAYAVLKKNAEFLSQQQEPSIDELVPLVERSMQAYQICQTRLAAIRQALDQQLPEMNRPETPAPVEESVPRKEPPLKSTPKPDPWDEEGIPF